MFTGIVEALSSVCAITEADGVRRMCIDAPADFAVSVASGDSVSVNGVCLTRVNSAASEALEFDVVQETLFRSNLRALQEGDKVNLERALRFGDRLGGHLTSGHVWSTETCLALERDGENLVAWFSLQSTSAPYVLHKGFVALDGVSLTIARIERHDAVAKFAVSLIPETRQRTRFGELREGDCVNLEVDTQTQAVVDTVRSMLANQPDVISAALLGKS